eukprot:CAMPEP_0202860194 /NCGR_PEP_ID=MMETSP1391-20130828/2008_1 /ASSEMBLY_ACC=CAM_ASM_000867 /TAXON_ID=1034604 /ORGANISM="Chlamydomonas leiostraca, Strain SAG 11-49" /LENGTH=281 /DNA_ID=CAMNT_0049539335 /DNA_START=154 /DNA_END=999 /DNA_ORIENTATION=-
MAAPVQEVHLCHVHGATLASMFHACISSGRDCDGLLFGQHHTKQIKQMDDDIGLVTIEEHHVYITGFVCSATACSFYDGAGRLQGDKLSQLKPPQGDPLIGWLSMRPGTPLQPSMRELAVTQQLHSQVAAAVGRAVPTLLLVVSTQSEHSGATLTLQYKVFQAPPASSSQAQQPAKPLALQPTTTTVINLGRSLGQKGYDSFEPVMPVMPRSGGADTRSLEQSADAVVQQVQFVEEYYSGLLKELQVLCRDVSAQGGNIAALQAEGEALMAELQSDALATR